ncbi:MAG TPA: EF-P beta-lysylation protein EpmB, partial [Steroidobacteraceae bacterium]|nr:EF-P beta-lysylation protein EpmB [Steroidobacteraceae bacterium]
HPPQRPDDTAASAVSWQRELAAAIEDPLELCRLLQLDPAVALAGLGAAQGFRLRVPRGYVARMRRADPNDPLLRQVLPQAAELIERSGYCSDPLAEADSRRAPGLLHKYHGRALLLTTAACAVHCRYCFRREYPYGEVQGPWLTEALDIIRQDPSIEEVILSGGDPLTLATARLRRLTGQLAEMPHVRRLRLHTRTPIVLPERIDESLCRWLSALPWPVVFVLHANHARDVDAQVRIALQRLRASGATLLNQAVLLAGVNDSVEALHGLSEALWEAGVLPYYLHLLDPVRGTAHFAVDERHARELMAGLAARLPGYLVPRLVRESAGEPAKRVIAPAAWSTERDALHSPRRGEC